MLAFMPDSRTCAGPFLLLTPTCSDVEAAQTLIEAPRLGANSLIEEWRLFCIKEKAIYATLNMFDA